MPGDGGRFEPRRITAAIIARFRDETGLGIMQAKRIAIRCREKEAFGLLMAEGTAEEKIDWLLRRYAETALQPDHPADEPLYEAFRRIDEASPAGDPDPDP